MKLALVSKEGHAREAYLKAISEFGADIEVVSSFTELFEGKHEIPFSGILVDFATNMKLSQEEKLFAIELLEPFPMIHLQWDEGSESIRTYSAGAIGDISFLANFVISKCKAFQARVLRINPRKNINFNITLSKDKSFISLERTVTINASKGGFFIFTAKDWEGVKHAWFTVKELHGNSPIIGDVKWFSPWGRKLQFSGIGINFKEIKPSQSEEILKFLSPAQP